MGGRRGNLLSEPRDTGLEHRRIVARQSHRADEGHDTGAGDPGREGKIIGLLRAQTPVAALRAALENSPILVSLEAETAKRRASLPKDFAARKKAAQEIVPRLGRVFLSDELHHPSSKLLCLKRSIYADACHWS